MSLEFKSQNCSDVLTDECVEFLAGLFDRFIPRLDELLELRSERQREYDAGKLPAFPVETSDIRDSEWFVAPIPNDLLDRRVEITGPPSRKMVINALNSGANVYMADFEDSMSPTWENVIDGHRNMYDAVRGTISYSHPTKGIYTLNKDHAVLFVRPRGLHLTEKHMIFKGRPVPASLFDFGVYMFLNARYLINKGTAPYFYIPKLEHYLEARWWNDVFNYAQQKLKVPTGMIRATVLLETLPAAFQMDEILYELRDHSAGLNCGRWDYIFSYIKVFQNDSSRVLPDRSQVTMSSHFMDAYSKRVIQVCHRRRAHAMGGMAAQIPIKNDSDANDAAMAKVRNDKIREVKSGHDGTWVAHPGLVGLARSVFDEFMPQNNQISKSTSYSCSEDDLITATPGSVTEAGVRLNVRVGYEYVEQWINGNGCVPINHLMEDAATAEISRTQLWQWRKNNVTLSCGSVLTDGFLQDIIADELGQNRLTTAGKLFESMCMQDTLQDFLTIEAYKEL